MDARRLEWMRRQMPLTEWQIEAMPQLDDVRLALSAHLEHKVVRLFEGLLERGAAVFLTTCNPSTVRDDVVEHVVARGAKAHAWKGMSADDERAAVASALDWKPTHLCEMGAELTSAIVEGERTTDVRASLEATGSGISRLARVSSCGFPIFNWDDLPIKERLHNRYVVGLTTWHTFTERTSLSLHGRRVLVIGFGLVGHGVAEAARSLGGAVTVAEADPARRLEARYAGFETGAIEELLPRSDVVVTATGASNVLGRSHFGQLQDGCFLLNAGHSPDEIDVEGLGARTELVPFVEEARLGDRSIYLFASGSMANLTAGQGDTLNAFDLTLATMAAGLRFIFSGEMSGYGPGVVPLPADVWQPVAERAARRHSADG